MTDRRELDWISMVCVMTRPVGKSAVHIIQILTGAEVNTEKFCPEVV